MDKLTKGWVHHLRKTARQETAGRGSCPLCEAEIQPDIDSFRAHVRADATRHPSLADDADIEQAFQNVTIHSPQFVAPPLLPRPRRRIDHGHAHVCAQPRDIGITRLLPAVRLKPTDRAGRTENGRPPATWTRPIGQTRASAYRTSPRRVSAAARRYARPLPR